LSELRRTVRSGAKLKGPGVDDDDPAAKFRVGLITGVLPALPKLPKLLLEEETASLMEEDDISTE
jgi:hypothetical protein